MFFPQQLRDGPLEKYWGWGEGGQKPKKNFPKKIINKKCIPTDSGQTKYMSKGKKKISTLHEQKNSCIS